jgi:hypothetical protein
MAFNTSSHDNNAGALSLVLEIKGLAIAMRQLKHQIITTKFAMERLFQHSPTTTTTLSETINNLIVAFVRYYQKIHAVFEAAIKAFERARLLARTGNLPVEIWEKVKSLEVEHGAVVAAYEEGFEMIGMLEAKNAAEKRTSII